MTRLQFSFTVFPSALISFKFRRRSEQADVHFRHLVRFLYCLLLAAMHVFIPMDASGCRSRERQRFSGNRKMISRW